LEFNTKNENSKDSKISKRIFEDLGIQHKK